MRFPTQEIIKSRQEIQLHYFEQIKEHKKPRPVKWDFTILKNIKVKMEFCSKICIMPQEHITPHISDIMCTTYGDFQWRIYWNLDCTDWGAYIVNECGQTLDYTKFEIDCHDEWVKENLNL